MIKHYAKKYLGLAPVSCLSFVLGAFIEQLFGEGKMPEAAKIYQDATDFNKKHPTLNF